MTKIQHISLKRRTICFERLESRCLLAADVLATAEATVFAHIPQDLQGQPGQEVIAPVRIDNPAGIRGAEIRIRYDTDLLDTSVGQVRAGSVWPGANTEVVANVDEAAGTIIVWVFHPEALPSGSGSLLDVHFVIREDAQPGTTTLDFTRLQLNEGDIVPSPAPAEGADPTDGRITILAPGGTASISGFVYADTNTNNQPDPLEGVPATTITLVNLDSGQTLQAVTDDDGRYSFSNLAAGSYEIRQRQPAAFLDGGPNTIAVSLAAGQELENQNFRELGLRPEYVYSRLFTTPVMPIGSVAWRSAIREIVEDAEQNAEQNSEPAAAAATALSAPAQNEAPAAPAALPAGAEGEAVDVESWRASESAIAAAAAPAAAAIEAAAAAAVAAEELSNDLLAAATDLLLDLPIDQPAAMEADPLLAGAEGEAVWDAGWIAQLPPAAPPVPVAKPAAIGRPVAAAPPVTTPLVTRAADAPLTLRAAAELPAQSLQAASIPAASASESPALFTQPAQFEPGEAVASAATADAPWAADSGDSADDTLAYRGAAAEDDAPALVLKTTKSNGSPGSDEADLLFASEELGLL